MSSCTIINARVITLARHTDQPNCARHGGDMNDIGVIANGHVCMRNGVITKVGAGHTDDIQGEVIDADGRVCMPALIDCHTHLCFAGERWSEWDRLRAGDSYESILSAGGGIMSTVSATRQATMESLAHDLQARLRALEQLGVGAVEVKSGYGLDWPTELKMLSAIKLAARNTPQHIVATCLGGHAIPKDNPEWPAQFAQGIGQLSAQFPGVAVDAFCESSALSVEQCRTLFTHAMQNNVPRRLHTDQFNSIGGVAMALEMQACTVDHLEAADDASLKSIAQSQTIAVLLPCSVYALGGTYARGKYLIDHGGAVAVGSNSNPGSAPTIDLRFAMHLAVRHCGFTTAQAITAVTWNAACVLGLQDKIGSIAAGKCADVIVLQERDERALTHGFAGPPPRQVVLGGRIVNPYSVHTTPIA